MSSVLSALGVTTPVLAAPMAGGPSTVELVAAAAGVGSLGFLAGGYKRTAQLAEQISAVRAAGVTFGVNLFVPNPTHVSRADYAAYSAALRPIADHLQVTLPDEPLEDDDEWSAKLDLLLTDPVPLVSFTFGLPTSRDVSMLQKRGTAVALSVTSVPEAEAAAALAPDLIVLQGRAAGGHSVTLTPGRTSDPIPLAVLIAMVQDVSRLPLIAAGGLSDTTHVVAAIHSGAAAAMVGTALLRSPESGASSTHKAAVADATGPDTVVTRSFTGRPARAIRNTFVDRFDAHAPSGYPALHHLTAGLRRAAAQAGESGLVHLWAGTGYRRSTSDPAAQVLTRVARDL